MAEYSCRGKKKLWTVRFRIIEDNQLVYKRLSGFQRKKDAEVAYHDFLNEYEEKIKNQKLTASDDVLEKPFTFLMNEFLKYKEDKVKESSFYDLTKSVEKHILPFFSNYKLKEITKTTILTWQQSLNQYSYKYKTKLRGYLYSFYKYLFLYHDVDNIILRVEPFVRPNEKKEMQIWSHEEFDKFLDTFDDTSPFKTFFIFLYYTGCRLGEVLALNYNDFNFEKKIVKIDKNLSSRTLNGSYKITSPKTKSSFRNIILPNTLLNELNKYINNNPKIKNSKFFFGEDKPLDDHTIYRRLDEHTKLAQLHKIRVHDFRHSHASLLINLGANIVLVSKRLGHSDTQQTLNTYSHLYPNSEMEIVNKLNNL